MKTAFIVMLIFVVDVVIGCTFIDWINNKTAKIGYFTNIQQEQGFTENSTNSSFGGNLKRFWIWRNCCDIKWKCFFYNESSWTWHFVSSKTQKDTVFTVTLAQADTVWRNKTSSEAFIKNKKTDLGSGLMLLHQTDCNTFRFKLCPVLAGTHKQERLASSLFYIRLHLL